MKITEKFVKGFIRCESLSKAQSCKFKAEGIHFWIEDEKKFYYVSIEGGTLQEVPPNIKIIIPTAILPVKISEISEHGFRLQVLDRDYYLSRYRYPYFSDATEEEIRDAVLMYESHIQWKTLDLRFELEQLDHPEEGTTFSLFVRGIPRPDLFEEYFDKETGFAMIARARELEEKNRIIL